MEGEHFLVKKCINSEQKTLNKIFISIFYSFAATPSPIVKAATIPATATSAVSEEKVNATQKKFQNFDSELTQLISGLKSNLTKETEEASLLDDDKLILDDNEPSGESLLEIETDITVTNEPSSEQTVISISGNPSQQSVNKPLADIVIDLNEIRPNDDYAPRCIMDEKSGLKIMLNFTKDKPRPDVAVLVITTTNHNKLPVQNFQFEASVPKVRKEIQKICRQIH